MGRTEAVRTCIATREVRRPDEMIRFVLAPDGMVVPDLHRRLPGRGAWVSARREAVAEAVKRRAFSRSLRTQAQAPADLADRIECLLVTDLRQSLALANKAGHVVFGFDAVESAFAPGRIAALIHAREAAADGRRKLGQALRRRLGDAADTIPVVDDLSADDLGLALGRSHVIHAAVVVGAGSKGFLERCRRLHVFRGSIAMAPAPLDEGSPTSDDNETAGL